MAFGCFKLAVVLEGIHARFLQHKTVGEGFEREGQAVAALIARAHDLLDGGLTQTAISSQRIACWSPDLGKEVCYGARRPALAGPHAYPGSGPG